MFAKKSLGQNFLRNDEVIADIISAAQIKPGDVVLEVGPGEGVLTQALLDAGASVIAVEKDSRLIASLKHKFPTAQIIEGDILTLNFVADKIVANIPYYITGQFLRKVFEGSPLPSRIVLMLQKEVAERIVAKDGKESLLSISVKAYGTPSIVGYVGRDNFEPAPDVDSAVLLIEDISQDFFKEIDKLSFFELLHKGFKGKRKQIGKKFGLVGDARRAEELNLPDWRDLYFELIK